MLPLSAARMEQEVTDQSAMPMTKLTLTSETLQALFLEQIKHDETNQFLRSSGSCESMRLLNKLV